MSKTREISFDVPWTSSEGRSYDIPVTACLRYIPAGGDCDPGWVFDDFALDGLDDSELPTLLTDKDDLDEFCLDSLSETVFEMALDRVCDD